MFWLFRAHYTKQVSRCTFRRIWLRYRPLVQRMTPRVDVCPECEHFRDEIRVANSVSRANQDEDIPSDEENFSTVMLQFQAHLALADLSRQFSVNRFNYLMKKILPFVQNRDKNSYQQMLLNDLRQFRYHVALNRL